MFSKFEVILSGDILQELRSAEKLFNHDLSVHVIDSDVSSTDAGRLPEVHLKKISSDIVKLYITFYHNDKTTTDEFGSQTATMEIGQISTQTNSSEWTKAGNTQTNSSEFSVIGATQTDGLASHVGITQTETLGSNTAKTQTDISQVINNLTQTDGSEWLCSTSTQTNNGEWQTAQFTQWDCNDWVTSMTTQTNIIHVTSSSIQTDEKRLKQTFTDRTVETTANISTQVTVDVQASVETSESPCQVCVSVVDMPVQASVDVSNNEIQTDERQDIESHSQTDISYAWRSDCEIQNTVDTVDVVVQADVDRSESAVQAVVDVVETTIQTSVDTVEAMAQVSVEMVASVVQTEAAVSIDTHSQTTSSMACETDCEVQASISSSAISCQTESTIAESFSQTDLSSDGEIHAECKQLISETSYQPPAAVNESFDEFGTSLLSQSIADASFMTAFEHNNMIDGFSQTDPVTIIIGDASFLVKKLKSSAVSPSKVTTTGNEIEIEVSPDVVCNTTQMVNEEKENTSINQRSVFSPGPILTAGSGLMVRGGLSVGPRLRMPVTSATRTQQQQVVTAARTPGGLLVRHPTSASISTPTVTTIPIQPVMIPGPQPIVGGPMSCPFCSLAFIDSPALYEHLSLQHTVDQKTKWRQPKGRQGKTIIPQKRSGSVTAQGSTDQGPPILTPIEPFNVSASGINYHSPVASTASTLEHPSASDDAYLFEDPVEPDIKKVGGSRQTKADNVDQSVPPTKRLRTNDYETAASNDDNEGDTLTTARRSRQTTNDTVESPQTPSRRGRSPRSQRK